MFPSGVTILNLKDSCSLQGLQGFIFPSGVTILNTRVHVPFRDYNPKYKWFMFPSGVTILNTRVHVPFRDYNPKYKGFMFPSGITILNTRGSCSLLINIQILYYLIIIGLPDTLDLA